MSSLIVSCRDNIWHSTNFIAMVGLRDKANRQFQGPIILGFFWAAPEVHNQESLNTFSRNERQLHKYYPSHNYQRNVFKCIYIYFFSLLVIFFIYFIDYVNSTRTPKEKYIFAVVSSCSNTDIRQSWTFNCNKILIISQTSHDIDSPVRYTSLSMYVKY